WSITTRCCSSIPTRRSRRRPASASRRSNRACKPRPVEMRAVNFFALGAAAMLLAGCAGYHLGPAGGAVAGDKTIEVLPFNNQTLEPRLGDVVTQALRERLQLDGTYRLATRAAGDVVVSGVVKNYN